MSELTWLKYEVILHWVAVVFYIVATVLFTYSVFFRNGAFLRRALGASMVGLIPHSIALVVRWIEQGHGPYMSRYEVLSSDAWIAVVLFLFFAWKWERIRPAGMIVLPLSFLMIALGLLTNPGMHNLPPSLRSIWLILHVSFAKLAAGSFFISLGVAILYLLKGRDPSKLLYGRLPSLDILDEYSYKFAGFGFIFWTINIVAGAIWADQSWGRYWGWDPIETWSLVTWLMYGMFAHLRVFWKLRGKKSAFVLIGCFIMSVFTIFALPFLANSLHSEYLIK